MQGICQLFADLVQCLENNSRKGFESHHNSKPLQTQLFAFWNSISMSEEYILQIYAAQFLQKYQNLAKD